VRTRQVNAAQMAIHQVAGQEPVSHAPVFQDPG
jgi:hypothetical protein